MTEICAWCGRRFTPRTTGGHTQRYCLTDCRRACDAAGRRWVTEAMAAGALTLDQLRNGSLRTRALLPGGISLAQISEPAKPAPVAPAAVPGDAAKLFDQLLTALLDLDLPREEWFALLDKLPRKLHKRLCDRIEAIAG